jgi:dynein heavy chain, axonemal
MTLIVSVIGKYGDDTIEIHEKLDADVYKYDNEDPELTIDKDKVTATGDPKIGSSESFIVANSGKMIIEPFMEDLPELFKSYFVQILHVGYNIPRLEYCLTRGMYVHICVRPSSGMETH